MKENASSKPNAFVIKNRIYNRRPTNVKEKMIKQMLRFLEISPLVEAIAKLLTLSGELF